MGQADLLAHTACSVLIICRLLFFSPYEFLTLPNQVLKTEMFLTCFGGFYGVFMPFGFYNPNRMGRARSS